MLKGIDVKERFNFISKIDKGDNPTIFVLGNMTNRQKFAIASGVQSNDGSIDNKVIQEKMFDIIKACLKEIKNLDGKDYNNIDDSVLDLIELPVLVEIVEKIISMSFPTGQEIKN
ncbi:MAG TPA: hypothetical protein PKN54_00530 [Candidatus Cloacimonas acidaminovorans]|nr:hypothetical protein [Candidatus Cloacimonas acidaminovorans]